MSMSSATSIFVISLLAIPLTYSVNTAQNFHGELGLFVAGVGALLLVITLTYIFVGRKSGASDSLYYVMTICTFGGVASLIIAMEGDGIITGFMTNYLREGEPYLKTGHGILVSYWDGIGHYSMCLLMLSAMSFNQSYREVGLYWAGSIGHSMIVFIPGNVVGKYGLRWSFLLNVPYMILPFTAAARFLRERPPMTGVSSRSILKRPVDLFFLIGIVLSAAVALWRGFAVLGCHHEYFTDYIKTVEPYLEDPVAYPKIQMLVYLFYYVPYYMVSIYALLFGSSGGWMADWALLHAGAAAQAQVTHIGASFHNRTPYVLRVPPNPAARNIFWAINLGLLVFPQLLAWTLNSSSNLKVKAK